MGGLNDKEMRYGLIDEDVVVDEKVYGRAGWKEVWRCTLPAME